MNRVIYDCHTHTFLCGHAEMVLPRAFMAIANAHNIKGFAYCCHNPFRNDDITPKYRMKFDDLQVFEQLYQQEIIITKKYFPHLNIVRSMEIDFEPNNIPETQYIVDLCQNYDYLLGSLHYYTELKGLRDKKIPATTEEKIKLIQVIFQSMEALIEYDQFDVICHLDFFKSRLGYEWYHTEEVQQQLIPLFNQVLDQIAVQNQCRLQQNRCPVSIECNTNGLKYGDEIYLPSLNILQQANIRGIPICLSSDCHWLKDVLICFQQALFDLKQAGINQLSYYKEKQIYFYKIDDAIDSFNNNVNIQKVLHQVFENENYLVQ